MKSVLKDVLESCSPEERSEAAAYLGVLDRVQNNEFQQAMARRSADLQAGRNSLRAEVVSEVDSALSDRGL